MEILAVMSYSLFKPLYAFLDTDRSQGLPPEIIDYVIREFHKEFDAIQKEQNDVYYAIHLGSTRDWHVAAIYDTEQEARDDLPRVAELFGNDDDPSLFAIVEGKKSSRMFPYANDDAVATVHFTEDGSLVWYEGQGIGEVMERLQG